RTGGPYAQLAGRVVSPGPEALQHVESESMRGASLQVHELVETATAPAIQDRSGQAEPIERRTVAQLTGALGAPTGGDRDRLCRARRRSQRGESLHAPSQP